MPLKEHLSDDFIASLLAKDAKASNAKYSSYGLQELLPKRYILLFCNHLLSVPNCPRPTYNAPKANTRFLKNIIRETDNHNAALRAKGLADSRSRLRKLHGRSRTSSPKEEDVKLSKKKDHRSKRRRVEEAEEPSHNQPRGYRKSASERDRKTSSRSHHSDRRYRDEHYDSNAEGNGQSRHHHSHHYHGSHRLRSRRRSPARYRGSRDCQRSSRSPTSSRSRSPRSDRKHHRRRSHHRSESKLLNSLEKDKIQFTQNAFDERQKDPSTKHSPSSTEVKRAPSPTSDSDPLEAIIGPHPPSPKPKVKARGRGTFASASAMDSHFSSNYDPTVDVQPDPETDDDWDMALEALRDRQKWQKQGAERLKAAGFTEEEIQKWEKGGEKREEDVKWKGRGEGREWDRGKVVGEDGIETEPEWGRLKGA